MDWAALGVIPLHLAQAAVCPSVVLNTISNYSHVIEYSLCAGALHRLSHEIFTALPGSRFCYYHATFTHGETEMQEVLQLESSRASTQARVASLQAPT